MTFTGNVPTSGPEVLSRWISIALGLVALGFVSALTDAVNVQPTLPKIHVLHFDVIIVLNRIKQLCRLGGFGFDTTGFVFHGLGVKPSTRLFLASLRVWDQAWPPGWTFLTHVHGHDRAVGD